MRIRDWSSDGCSSDLAHGVAPGKDSLKRRITRVLDARAKRGPAGPGWIALTLAFPAGEIGIASSRVRVRLFVYISFVSVPLNKIHLIHTPFFPYSLIPPVTATSM